MGQNGNRVEIHELGRLGDRDRRGRHVPTSLEIDYEQHEACVRDQSEYLEGEHFHGPFEVRDGYREHIRETVQRRLRYTDAEPHKNDNGRGGTFQTTLSHTREEPRVRGEETKVGTFLAKGRENLLSQACCLPRKFKNQYTRFFIIRIWKFALITYAFFNPLS